MDHKTILAAGGAILVTIVAASSAMALNLGILDSPATDNVGEMEIRPVASSNAEPRPSVPSSSPDVSAEPPTTTTVPRPSAVVNTPSVTRSLATTTSVASDDRNGRTGSNDEDEHVRRNGRDDD